MSKKDEAIRFFNNPHGRERSFLESITYTDSASPVVVADDTETQAGVDDTKIVSPLKLSNWWTNIKTLPQTLNNYISAKGFKITPTDGTGYIELNGQVSIPATPGSGILRFFADASGRLTWLSPLGFTRAFRSSVLTGNRVYTLQDRDGQLADDTSISISGSSGAGFIEFPLQSSSPSTPSSGFRIFANSAGKLAWKGTNGFQRIFDGTANSADRTYTLPDADGNILLDTATQTLTNKTLTAPTISTINGSSASGGSLTLNSTSNAVKGNIIATSNLIFGTDNIYDIGASGANRPRNIYTAGWVAAGFNSALYIQSRIGIKSPSTGVATLLDNAETDFGRLQFGGTTASFPAIKRNGTGIDIRFADDSGYSGLTSSIQTVSTTTTPSPASGFATFWFDGTNVKVTKNVGGTTTTATIF